MAVRASLRAGPNRLTGNDRGRRSPCARRQPDFGWQAEPESYSLNPDDSKIVTSRGWRLAGLAGDEAAGAVCLRPL
jgi:hypothetical protein